MADDGGKLSGRMTMAIAVAGLLFTIIVQVGGQWTDRVRRDAQAEDMADDIKTLGDRLDVMQRDRSDKSAANGLRHQNTETRVTIVETKLETLVNTVRDGLTELKMGQQRFNEMLQQWMRERRAERADPDAFTAPPAINRQ